MPRSPSTHSMRPATSAPTAWAVYLPCSSAVTEKSTAVTCHPEAASQIVSAPCPQPASRARPGASPPISARKRALGARLATWSGCSRRACAQRRSQKSRSNVSLIVALLDHVRPYVVTAQVDRVHRYASTSSGPTPTPRAATPVAASPMQARWRCVSPSAQLGRDTPRLCGEPRNEVAHRSWSDS